MSLKEDVIGIQITSSSNDKLPETTNKFKIWLNKILEFAKEDSNRVTFSLKVGFAVLLVSLLILFQAPYQVFGNDIIWSILTVAIMFEYTVGATFHKGFNRAVGSLCAGVLAIAVAEVALMSGRVAEPFIIGISIFMIGAVTSFMKLCPTFEPHEYGFRVILFTYCLIIVSGYRVGNPTRTSIERFYSILIGAVVTVAVNTLVFPVWAGEQLHKELVKNFDSVADSLEECVKNYLAGDGTDRLEFTKTLIDEKCRSTLNSSAKLESLALSATWEPPHGRFRHLLYPWSEYVKVGTVLRYCAYEVMALHGVLHSQIQAPYDLKLIFQTEILETTSKAAAIVRYLAKDIADMKQTVKCSLLKSVHSTTERLQRAIDLHLFKNDNSEYAINNQNQSRSESYHETVVTVGTWESTAESSLVTFTSLLIEFVARLDRLVEAVNELSKMAKFKHESL